MSNTIVVIGAGVSGLTSALLLAKSSSNKITIVAKHMPGDYDIEYASPWAGANIQPMATREKSHWERRSWPEIKRITEEVPEAGLHFQKSHIFRRDKDMKEDGSGAENPLFEKDSWYKDVLGGYRELGQEELIPDHQVGWEVNSVCINTAIYLPWLVGQCLKAGIIFKRGVISHISDAKTLSHTGKPADFIINTTGLGAMKLGGVSDTTMMPVRGQIVLVRNECSPMVASSGSDDASNELLYIMQRAAGGGTILGGTIDYGNWESMPDPNIAVRIMQRAVTARPEMAGGKGVAGLSIIRHAVGLRPYRAGGVRIEEEQLDEETWIVHNYGHAGWGYQASYGCAEGVVGLVNKICREKGQSLEEEPKIFSWE